MSGGYIPLATWLGKIKCTSQCLGVLLKSCNYLINIKSVCAIEIYWLSTDQTARFNAEVTDEELSVKQSQLRCNFCHKGWNKKELSTPARIHGELNFQPNIKFYAEKIRTCLDGSLLKWMYESMPENFWKRNELWCFHNGRNFHLKILVFLWLIEIYLWRR